MSDYDLAVVGLGAMGAATLECAARRGLRVLGIERFEPLHARGGSHGLSRMIRKAYFEDPAYVPLVLRAYELWNGLELRTGRRALTITGVLEVGLPSSVIVRGVVRSARERDLAIEAYDAAEMRRRFPMFRPLDGEIGVFEAGAGVLVPERALEMLLDSARSHGAQTRFATRVQGLESGVGGLEIRLEGGARVTADRAAVCSGSWLGELVPQLARAIRVRRKVQAWFGNAEACPPFLVDRAELGEIFYGFPDFGDGVKASFHTGGEAIDPEAVDRDVHDDEIAAIRGALERWFPSAAIRFSRASVCLYDMSPDENFIVGAHPEEPRIVVCGGFSGHGFKFAPAIGEIATDFAIDGGTSHDVAFLTPQRFAAGVSPAHKR